MKRIRRLTSWLSKPTTKHGRLAVEPLEDRLAPSASNKLLAAPVRLEELSTTQDLLALTPAANPLNDLANAVDHFQLHGVVEVARSTVIFGSDSAKLVQIRLRDGVNVRAAVQTLMSTGLFATVAPNYIYPQGLSGRDLVERVPNDPQFPNQYPHLIIDSPRAWDTTFGSSSVIVGILDDGLDLNHPDLIDNIWINSAEIAGDGIDNDGNGYIDDRFGWNFIGDNANVLPDDPTLDTHGTQVAGLIAGRIDNSVGVAGVAGRVRVMPLKVVGNGPTTSLALAKAVGYAVAKGVKIINSSINIDPFVGDPTFLAAVSHAHAKGVLWVNSAGNLNLQDPARASLDAMLIAAATDRSDVKAAYSNYGWGIDIAAPGGSADDPIVTTVPGGYGPAFGTSVSAPLVAGTAALLWSANPTWNRDQVASAILAVTDTIDGVNPAFLDKLGTGRLDAGQSVSGGPFATKLGRLYEMPGPGEDAPPGFDSFRLRLRGNLDAATVIPQNFELRWAGSDNLFDTPDDRTIGLNIANAHIYGTNSIDFQLFEQLAPGLYRFTARSGGLKDPFGTPVDGDNDGFAGGDLVRYFGNPLRASGTISEDVDADGVSTPGDPPVPGAGVFGDLNGNGSWDTSSFPSTTAPQTIPDNPNASAGFNIVVSGFTRPINFIAVQVVVSHPAPADLVMTLIAPTGQRVVLFANRPVPGTGSPASHNFYFEDGIVESSIVTANSNSHRLRPDQPLSSLYGGSANGVWRVEVVDVTPGDDGTLISASITISEEPLARANARGEWAITTEPSVITTIYILPPTGWAVSGPDPNPGFNADHLKREPLRIGLVRTTGIQGQVRDSLGGVANVTVYLDRDNDGEISNGDLIESTNTHGVFAFSNLPPGSYTIRLTPKPGYLISVNEQQTTLTISQPFSGGHVFAITRDTQPVRVELPILAPTLRTTPVVSIPISISEPVGRLNISNLRLTRDGVDISLATATVLGSGTAFTLVGLEALTRIDGHYTLTVLAPAPDGEPGRAPSPAVTSWTLDATAPTATLSPITNSRGVVDQVTLLFSSPVNGLDLTDFVLRRNGLILSLANAALSSSGIPGQFTLGNLASIASAPGTYTLELMSIGITDIAGNLLVPTSPITWTVQPRPVRFTAVAAGEGSQPTVAVFDTDGKLVRTLTPYELSFTGGVRVATGDVTGDGVDDIIVVPGRGSGPRVKVYDGVTGLVISDFFAFEPSFRGGLFVAAGDITGDGIAEIVVSPDKGGGPRVRVLHALTAATVADFFGIHDVNFRGGARAALGDVTGDGRLDLVVSAGTGGGPRIAVFDGASVAQNSPTKPVGDFFAFEPHLRNGAYITVADLNGDGFAEIIAGAGDGGGPRLTAYSGQALLRNQYSKLCDFFVGDIALRGGLRLAVEDHNDDGVFEVLVAGGNGARSLIRIFNADSLIGDNPNPMRVFDPFGGFLGGVFLG